MKDTRKPNVRSARQFKFEKDREDWSDREIQIAQLYYLTLIQSSTEKSRSDLSIIVWIIVIMILLSIIGFFYGSMLGV
ncbi:MAG TPA: hypothetical protein VFM69_06340 [Pricia sp.]|nr:hypothetical protein [Pricia sp.]